MGNDILLPVKPRRENPEGHIVVQQNVDYLASLFQTGIGEDDIPLWDQLTGKFITGPLPQYLLGVPRTRVVLTADETITNASDDVISWDSSPVLSDNMWVIGSPTRLTFPETAPFWVAAKVLWEGNAAGSYRRTRLRLNGTTIIDGSSGTPSAAYYVTNTIGILYAMQANDYVEIVCDQDSGADRLVWDTEDGGCHFEAFRVL